jgi:hypothetical protein
MKQILLLAATAAAIAACHSQNEDQAGPAPSAANDSTGVVRVIDSTRTGPPGTQGRPPASTVTPDSVGIPDSAARADTISTSPSPTSVPQDTLGPRTDSLPTDSTSAQ